MIFFPGCKINIGLRILSRREDGYHNIETAMYPVDGLSDALEIIPSPAAGVKFSASGLAVDCAVEKNLCIKAYDAFKVECDIPGVEMHLHKAVPMGAGLGGGSADAAYVVGGLSRIFGLELSTAQMERIAAKVGSDAAFFIGNTPALATGRGELLSPLELPLSGKWLVIVKPDVSVSTARAYSIITPREHTVPLAELLSQPVSCWRDSVFNDFEKAVFPLCPELPVIKEAIYNSGALYCAMSGSGSAIYGIYDREPDDLLLPGDLFVYKDIIA